MSGYSKPADVLAIRPRRHVELPVLLARFVSRGQAKVLHPMPGPRNLHCQVRRLVRRLSPRRSMWRSAWPCASRASTWLSSPFALCQEQVEGHVF